MAITREYLQAELQNMIQQRAQGHELAIAAQGAIDVLQALLVKLEQEQSTEQESENGTV
jgi:uncharacterized protein YutE (UPF0331/DUF86 family)